MTDRQLNLIERVAQRIAEQRAETGTSKPEQPALVPSAVARPQPQSVQLPQDLRPGGSEGPGSAFERSRPIKLDFSALRQNGMITPDNMTSTISNEFRGIKRKLLQRVREPKTRQLLNNLVMVTSSLPGEGKTFTAMNLAMSLAAERGLNVLLVDGDVVRPAISQFFLSPPSEGLIELLTGKVTKASQVMFRPVDIPNLTVLFSGSADVTSPELVSSARMVDLANELAKRYPDRIVIIDTPPVLASPEATILASYVHELIMIVAADHTDRRQLQRALESVNSCKSISLLFNKAPAWSETDYMPYYGYRYPNSGNAPNTL